MKALPEIRVMRRALPTSRHAEMLFDSVLAGLGGEALVVSLGDGSERIIYRREAAGSPWIIPHALLGLTLGRRGSYVGIPGNFSDAVPAESGGEPSRLRNLQGGEIEIHGDDAKFDLTYAGDGQVVEIQRMKDEFLAALANAVENGTGNPVDRVARFILGREVGREAPGRVFFAEDCALAMPSAWEGGLRGMRRALFAGAPGSSGWIAADGYAGSSVGWGATRDEAVAACREAVLRDRPCPPPPRPIPEFTPEQLEAMGLDGGAPQVISRPAEDRVRGAPTPENTPIATTRFEIPAIDSSFGRSIALLDGRGRSQGALLREDREGCTIVGRGILDRIDVAELDDEIDRAIENWRLRHGPEPPWPDFLPPLHSREWTLEFDDKGLLHVRGSSTGPEFDAGAIDGAEQAAAVLRARPI